MTKRLPSEPIAYASATFAVDPANRKVIQLLSIGTVHPRNGVPPVVRVDDRTHADAIVAASQAYAGATDMVVDYDHQTVYAAQPGVGGRAAAAGWAKRLFATDEGVFAEVDWTEAANSALDAQEYRYISPVFNFEKTTGRVTRLINAALTNTPNLDLVAVATALHSEGKAEIMDLTKIAVALGLSADADETAVLSAIGGLNAQKDGLLATASALGLAATATNQEIATAAASAKAAVGNFDPAKFVPVATVEEMRAEMSSMRVEIDANADKRRTEMVDGAISTGKLFPSERQHYLDWAGKDEAACSAAIAARPAFKGGAQLTAEPDENGKVFDAEDQAVATAMGLSKEDFIASKEGISA